MLETGVVAERHPTHSSVRLNISPRNFPFSCLFKHYIWPAETEVCVHMQLPVASSYLPQIVGLYLGNPTAHPWDTCYSVDLLSSYCFVPVPKGTHTSVKVCQFLYVVSSPLQIVIACPGLWSLLASSRRHLAFWGVWKCSSIFLELFYLNPCE